MTPEQRRAAVVVVAVSAGLLAAFLVGRAYVFALIAGQPEGDA